MKRIALIDHYDSCSSLTDSNPDTDEEEVSSSHTRKRRRVEGDTDPSPLPRPPKTFSLPSEDVCYEYCRKIVELFNSMESRVTSKFLRSYCNRRAIKLSCLYSDSSEPDKVITKHSFHGREQISDYLNLLSVLSPDLIVELTGNPSFKIVENQALEVSFPCYMIGTNLFETSPAEMARFLNEYHKRCLVEPHYTCFQPIVPHILTLNKFQYSSSFNALERLYRKIYHPAFRLISLKRKTILSFKIQHRGYTAREEDEDEEENMSSFFLNEICIKSFW